MAGSFGVLYFAVFRVKAETHEHLSVSVIRIRVRMRIRENMEENNTVGVFRTQSNI